MTNIVKHEKLDPSFFEILKVLGQGSFGKVGVGRCDHDDEAGGDGKNDELVVVYVASTN